MIQFLTDHWKAILAAMIVYNFITSLPSPTNNGGILGTWYYKWLWASLHGVTLMIPRLIAVFFPASKAASIFTNGTTEAQPQNGGNKT
jgi:hypothetical protein